MQKKWLPNNQKMKCSFLDNIQLMICKAIQAMKVNQNAKKMATKSSRNEMLIFGLHSTSDAWPSDLSKKRQLKCEKWPPNCQKMKCSFLDYFQFLMISQAI